MCKREKRGRGREGEKGERKGERQGQEERTET